MDLGETSRSFSHTFCTYLAKFIKWLPVIFVSGVVVWSYYVFIVQLSIYQLEPWSVQQIVYIGTYHLLVIMMAWSFCATVSTDPGFIPNAWKLSRSMIDALLAAQTEDEWKRLLELFVVQLGVRVHQRSIQGAIRYCEKCFAVKPDRSHHCSVCEKCVLKMDHHCPWVNNCVGFHNYKFFFLFLFYAYLYTLWLLVTSALEFSNQLVQRNAALTRHVQINFHFVFLCVVAALFFLFLTSLFWYHLYLILRNRSTLEQFRAPVIGEAALEDERAWHLGVKGNLAQIFGRDWKKWMIPVPSSLGDGLGFPQRNHSEPMTVNNGKQNGNGSHVSLKSVVIVTDEAVAVNV